MKQSNMFTDAIHGGEKRSKYSDSLTTPIFQTSTYVFKNSDNIERFVKKELMHYEYGRYGNPTQQAAEKKLAILESGEDCLLFASGMAAITTSLMAFLSQGDHIILTDDSYKKTYQFCVQELTRFGVETSIVKMGNNDDIFNNIKKNTKIILTESPTNPYLNIANFEKLSQIKNNINPDILLVIDSTFGTPYNQQPLKWNCDLVFHSVTKYLAGHNDILAGAVIGSKKLIERIRVFQNATGGIIAPHCAYLLLRGLKTFPVRIQKQNESALKIAKALETKKNIIKKVYYPGLDSHHDHLLAKKQMNGYGGVISFVLNCSLKHVKIFLDSLKICQIAPSFGGVETLITHPAMISYYSYSKKERKKIGILDGLIRLSIGLEDPDDIINDLTIALNHIR